jgi:hypothetical protein
MLDICTTVVTVTQPDGYVVGFEWCKHPDVTSATAGCYSQLPPSLIGETRFGLLDN